MVMVFYVKRMKYFGLKKVSLIIKINYKYVPGNDPYSSQ